MVRVPTGFLSLPTVAVEAEVVGACRPAEWTAPMMYVSKLGARLR
jgi:hypothetical protein